MKNRKLDASATSLALWGLGSMMLVACSDDGLGTNDGVATTTGTSTSTSTGTSGLTTGEGDDESGFGMKLDVSSDPGSVPSCSTDGTCDLIDIVFVIDNSGTMGEEQLNLANNFQHLVDELQDLRDADGDPVRPNVNMMVTTSDFGHPLCTPHQRPDYVPRKGAPVYQGCNSRINRFTSLDETTILEEACTANCPADVAPGDHFINVHATGSNVPNGDVGAALSCIGPQGIDGCGYEAPLETMIQAIERESCWNDPSQPACADDPEWSRATRGFLRDDAILVVVIITDEMDCSVKAPHGYSYFTDPDNPAYWNLDPSAEQPVPAPTSAVCFNAGVTCTDADGDGVYEGGCQSQENDVLHPVWRYTEYLDYLRESQGKEVVMLGILGVPEVVAHNPLPPFEPIAGGAADLIYRNWVDFPYPNGDVLPEEWEEGKRAADKVFEFGDIGPGCTGVDEAGEYTGQAVPPVRIREVCEHLDGVDATGEARVRCCIESICDTDFSPAIRCLTGVLSDVISGPG